MSKNIRNGLQSLILSEGCQSLSNQADTAWIFPFIEQHHTQPNQIRDMWLFIDQDNQKDQQEDQGHESLEGQEAVLIWSIPPEGADQAKKWVMKGKSLKETEVLLFVQNSICYTLPEYLEVEFGKETRQLVPDIVFPRKLR